MNDLKFWLSLVIVLALNACASAPPPVKFEKFDPVDLGPKLQDGSYRQKVDNFFVIMDTSSTMNQRYLYEAFDSSGTPSLFEVEKEILSRLNQAIPPIRLNAAIRTFGFGSCQDWGFSVLRLAPGPYGRSSFEKALDSIPCAGGGSPLDYAIDQAAEDMSSMKGNTALIIIGDGDMDSTALDAALRIRRSYGVKSCTYTISMGSGSRQRITMRKLAAVSGCGFSVSAEKLAGKNGMSEFVEKVFLQKNERATLHR